MRAAVRCSWATFVVALVSILVLVACGTSPSPSPSSGVRGKALIVGGVAPGGPRPMSGVTVAVHRGQLRGPIVAKGQAASDGSFKFELSPGTYTLVEVSDAAVPQTLLVTSGQYARVRLLVRAR